MPTTKRIEEIQDIISKLQDDETAIDMLMEFERTMDRIGIFAYRNWIKGELIHGPDVTKYWFNTVWMFYEDDMPDPRAGLRLTKNGCYVYYEKAYFEEPVKVRGPGSLRDRNTKAPRLEKKPVWLVRIEMPRKFIDDGLDKLIRPKDLENEYYEKEQGIDKEEPMSGEEGMPGEENNEDELDI